MCCAARSCRASAPRSSPRARPSTCCAPTRRATRRAGSLVVVLGGVPALYAAAGLRSLLSFTDDGDALARAARALVAHEKRSLRRAGAEGARKKVVVETLNGRSILDSPLAEVLQDAGLVRLPDGMRLYVSPF